MSGVITNHAWKSELGSGWNFEISTGGPGRRLSWVNYYPGDSLVVRAKQYDWVKKIQEQNCLYVKIETKNLRHVLCCCCLLLNTFFFVSKLNSDLFVAECEEHFKERRQSASSSDCGGIFRSGSRAIGGRNVRRCLSAPISGFIFYLQAVSKKYNNIGLDIWWLLA